MPKSTLTGPITRRSFTVGAAAAATAALLPGREAYAQSTTPAQSKPDPMAKLSPGARAEVEMKVGEIFRKYGSRLSDEQKADIRKVMAETQDGLEKMRSYALANGDQPATAFKYTEEKADGHA
jgi:hypothetical protein